jgi:hypothetical protein
MTQIIPEVNKYAWKESSLIYLFITTGAIEKNSPVMTIILFQNTSWATKRLSVVYVKNKKKSTLIPNKAKPIKALKNRTLLSPNNKLVI